MTTYSLTQNGTGAPYASDLAVTTAGTTVCQEVSGLELDGVVIQSRFAYGSGGTSCTMFVETSFDSGSTWIEVLRLAFDTVSAVRLVNLSADVPVTTPYAPAVLTDDTSLDGLLGDRLRLTATTVGVYADSTLLSVRAVTR